MSQSSGNDPKLNSELRERLLRESRNPLLGLRRLLWVALCGSAFLGLFVMGFRALSGDIVPVKDASLQLFALLLFGWLLWKDRGRDK